MRGLFAVALIAIVSLSGCFGNKVGGSKGIDGYWMRIGDPQRGTVIKIDDNRGKIVYTSGSLKYAGFSNGDYKFKNIAKNSDGTYTAGDLYKGNKSVYEDVELKVNGKFLTVTSISDAKNVKLYVRVPEDFKRAYRFEDDGDVWTITLLPYGLLEFVDSSNVNSYNEVSYSTVIENTYFMYDDDSYKSLRIVDYKDSVKLYVGADDSATGKLVK